MKPSSLFSGECREALLVLVRERLREDHGVTVKPHDGAKRQRMGLASSSSTPGRPSSSSSSNPHPQLRKKNRVFGRLLRDLVPNACIMDGHQVEVPHFLSSVLNYLETEEALNTEGIFRRPGSYERQRAVRVEIGTAETFVTSVGPNDEPVYALDAASLLKQWIRELPEPLIPVAVQDAILSCMSLPAESERAAAATLCTLFLPPLRAACLALLSRFLREVHLRSERNKMSSRNLAIVFAPGLFPDRTGKKLAAASGLDAKVDAVQALIENAANVAMVDDETNEFIFSASGGTSMSEDNLDVDSCGGGGPSARRRKKKKRRSGSLSRVFTTTMKSIHKAISRSATPSASRSRSAHELHVQDHVECGGGEKKAMVMNAAITPKVVRGRSIKNRLRSVKKASSTGEQKSVNLPMTPMTPSSIPNPACDLSFGAKAQQRELSDASLDGSIRGLARRASHRLRRRDSKPVVAQPAVDNPDSCSTKPTAQSKIGQPRRRSRDMTRQLSSKSIPMDRSHLRRGQRNTFAVRPSPMKLDKSSRIKMSFKEGQIQKPTMMRRTANIADSLTNLRTDISSMIEKSFANKTKVDDVEVSFKMMRRQSSAFEFSKALPVPVAVRRQSSAFELRKAAAAKASSVRDLVKKLERVEFAKARSPSPPPPPIPPAAEDPSPAVAAAEEEWTDAKAFFSSDRTPPSVAVVDDDPIGCKRSSILRIRKERKGLVLKNVETFTTRPDKRQTMGLTPKRPPQDRRLSARMGLGSVPPPTPHRKPSGIRTTPQFKTPVSRAPVSRRDSVARRDHHVVGSAHKKAPKIVSLVHHDDASSSSKVVTPKHRHDSTAKRPIRDCKHPNSIRKQFEDPKRPVVKISSTSPSVENTTTSTKKRKRRTEDRRHLTIGYEGEVRSPLMEKQNLIASVQRSKSAQTPKTRRTPETRRTPNELKPSPYAKPARRGAMITDENSDQHPIPRLTLPSPAMRRSPRFAQEAV